MMPGGSRSAAGPAGDKLAVLIRPAVEAAGMDLESVKVRVVGRERRLEIIVDSDAGVSLDDAADASRVISKVLDDSDVMGEASYSLEVSSPGVSRPLTQPRHWRRAAGRLVKVKVAAEGAVTGRVAEADDDGVTLDVDGTSRRFGHSDLGPGSVQVEFGKVPDSELEDLNSNSDNGNPDEADHGAGGDGH